MEKQTIRDFSGWILGTIETAPNGDQTARNFSGWILGRYDAKQNVTRDFSGRILTSGNTLAALIQSDANKENK